MIEKEETKTRKAIKEYVLYVPKTDENDKSGFINIVDGISNIVEKISQAVKLTSVEANREASAFIKEKKLIPFKMKICDYKNYTFLHG